MYLPTALPFVSLQRYSNAPTASHSLIHIFHQLKSPRILWSFQNSTDPEEHLYLNKGKCTHSANRKPKLNSLLHLTGRKNKVPAVFHETALKSRLAGYSGENSVAPFFLQHPTWQGEKAMTKINCKRQDGYHRKMLLP